MVTSYYWKQLAAVFNPVLCPRVLSRASGETLTRPTDAGHLPKRDLDQEFLGLPRTDQMQARFVFRTVGRPHPRLDAVIRRFVIRRPSDDRGVFGRGVRETSIELQTLAARLFGHREGMATQPGVDGVDQSGIIECLALAK